MSAVMAKPEVKAKIQAHLHSEGNPFRHPETQAKSQVRLREMGYPMLNGGNGRGPSQAQLLLANRLQWPMEWVVRTQMGARSGYPGHYKIDIADPATRTAIEVDGYSHQARAVKERDDRKDAFLMGRGWRVLRFLNHEILEDLERVVAIVRSSISKPAAQTTSSMAS